MGRPSLIDSTEGIEKRLGILDAAASVFMNLGFSAASLDDISVAYGATKGIIYYYYRNKSALFFAVQRRAMELTREAIEPHALSAELPAVKLRKMAHDHTVLMMEHLAYLRVAAQGLELHLTGRTTASERAELEEILKLRAANEALYVRVIEEGVESGDFRAMDAKLLVKPLLGALNWTSRWYHPRKNETAKDRERVASELAGFAVSALLPHPQ
ncbi:TetR family transcriptional regulator [Achromobacter insolitus]|jgi:AcrR family transcriptional regulator|uniref:HTH tetR-type domain-containing protein n=1 Tax=Achromobacter insolitus TaxID=217204 RepID=A0A6S7F9P7_9BURK|nr:MULTISPECIES: TetR family transcriptional regulator [Achromobacter]GLK97286.1 TetR family transcriptional regulator [Achromobacter xylosoxidans]APX76873.1 TetR family transcriptional regulator [Achromobacter insolitus]AXA72745.1 TetR family transcriptional regulator [Achromobacter insolitus]MCP1405228.1 AcrR family transcriptional regulator [Achromobacter insolitus]MDH3066354.1 TetR family transcriptional regulator [Achromobacter insolitus]